MKSPPGSETRRPSRRSPHGERGLKFHGDWENHTGKGRSPHGERGLKYVPPYSLPGPVASLPTRGAWIEIPVVMDKLDRLCGRSPHGERGLKFPWNHLQHKTSSRSPHGERGLKSGCCPPDQTWPRSLPTRGAWIEIHPAGLMVDYHESLPTRGAWIEIGRYGGLCEADESLPTRGAWIEIVQRYAGDRNPDVAPHTGSVD